MELSANQIDWITQAYIACAIWADCPETDDNGEILEYIDWEVSAESKIRVRRAVEAFVAEHNADVIEALQSEGYGDNCAQDFGGTRSNEWPYHQLGHDLYLSTHGHGTGFFDRDELAEDLRDRLQSAADKYEGGRFKPWGMEPDFNAETGDVVFYG